MSVFILFQKPPFSDITAFSRNYNPGQNIWNKKREIQKNWTRQEKFDVNLCLFWGSKFNF